MPKRNQKTSKTDQKGAVTIWVVVVPGAGANLWPGERIRAWGVNAVLLLGEDEPGLTWRDSLLWRESRR